LFFEVEIPRHEDYMTILYQAMELNLLMSWVVGVTVWLSRAKKSPRGRRTMKLPSLIISTARSSSCLVFDENGGADGFVSGHGNPGNRRGMKE
jgi:hypothetical protein